MSNATKPRRWVWWSEAQAREVLDAFGASGMSLAAFAQTRGVSAHRIQYWRDKLASATPAMPEAQPAFLPVRLTNTERGSAEIVLDLGALSLRVREDIDPRRLAALVRALAASTRAC